MNHFAYEARDEDGRLTAGSIAAESLEHAGLLLSQRNLFVVRMAGDRTRGHRADVRGHATRAQVAWCMSQLSIMIETRIRLVDALECMARQATQPRLKALLEQINKGVQEGRPLSDAMEMSPKSFPSSLIAMIRASEMSGTMGQVLQRSSTYLMNDLQVLKRVRGALMYPAFMFTICLAVTVFLVTAILPRFADIFASRGALLPFPTRVLMALSQSLLLHWYVWIGGLLIVLLAAIIWSRTSLAKQQRDFLAIKLPVFSGIFRALYQSRVFRASAVLLDAGVSIIDVMKIIQDVVPNTQYRNLWREVDDQIQRGEHLAGPLLSSSLVSESVAQMIDSGDRSGKLGLVFSRLADFMEQEYDRAIRTATQFIEPCMILCMGSIIGFVAASLMLPLFQVGRVMTK